MRTKEPMRQRTRRRRAGARSLSRRGLTAPGRMIGLAGADRHGARLRGNDRLVGARCCLKGAGIGKAARRPEVD